MTHALPLAKSDDLALPPALANHHGLSTGTIGSGKTVTLQKLAEQWISVATAMKSPARSIGSTLGREVVRGVPGAILDNRKH